MYFLVKIKISHPIVWYSLIPLCDQLYTVVTNVFGLFSETPKIDLLKLLWIQNYLRANKFWMFVILSVATYFSVGWRFGESALVTSNIFFFDLNKWIWNFEWRINLQNIGMIQQRFIAYFFRIAFWDFFISYKLLSSHRHLTDAIVRYLMLEIRFFLSFKEYYRSRKIFFLSTLVLNKLK